MSDLSAAAAALGVPEAIVKRSAEARAKATGATVDEVLAAWAGGASAPTAPEPTAEVAPPEAPPPDARRETPEAAEEAQAISPAADTSETRVPRPASRVLEEPPPPKEVTPKEAVRYPVVVAFPTAGLKERTRSTIPWWLAATFIIVPLFGLLQLAGAATNECGVGTELLPDRVTGELRNCDGSEFEGRGPAGGGTDYFAIGSEVYVGAPGNCAGCHGTEGQGTTGPALTSVVAVFSSCLDHIEWVQKGTLGFQSEGRNTYGDTSKPVGAVGIMPSFGTSLSEEQLAAITFFERVRFGGQPREEALVDCGLAEVPPEEGEGAAEPGAEGATTTTAP